jgi:hypothetical protein
MLQGYLHTYFIAAGFFFIIKKPPSHAGGGGYILDDKIGGVGLGRQEKGEEKINITG